ncbi:dTMP kinase [Corynebacterium sp. H130]|uniref:dTMP kinase n=1 Tax=Corynebacterium sp. H130 TaxID=3133444 RepID=UPI00309AA61D
MIICIEGIDGAGKNTLATALAEHITVERLAFPRYDESIHAQLALRALRHQMGDLIDSAYGMATLFALDRHGAVDKLRAAAQGDNILLLDRYVASNAAYSWARTQDESIVAWVENLEFESLGLPRPDLQILLDTPVEVAAERANQRAIDDTNRAKDAYETDGGLQARTCDAYRRLAAESWGSEWIVAAPNEDVTTLSRRIIARIRDQKNL